MGSTFNAAKSRLCSFHQAGARLISKSPRRRRRMAVKKELRPRSSGPLDKALGEKSRTRRVAAGMSQTQLGEASGVSFQQVQKYEKGVNRISASRLAQIAAAFDESISYFQTDDHAISKAGQELQALMTDPLNLRMCRALSGIENQTMRFQFVRLVES